MARFRSLFVIARNSSFAFRGKPMDLAEIGRKLGVSYILEGSVRRAGHRVRITAQLIEAANGAHLWAERYDRSLDDIFAVQDEVAQTIVSTLVGRIEEANCSNRSESRRPTWLPTIACCAAWPTFEATRKTTTSEPWRCSRRRSPSIRGMRWRTPTLAYVPVAMHGYATAPAEVLDAAFAKAGTRSNSTLRKAAATGYCRTICLYRREYDMAEQHIRRAFDLNPNDAEAMIAKGRVLAARGRPEEALRLL